MIPNKNIANAVGGKTARACDSCIKKRAHWYCAADDAFLCQACDSSVHSANPLARRHQRVRLKTASFKSSTTNSTNSSVPSWHGGFTRKARTPRHGKSKTGRSIRNTTLLLVPEVGSDEISHDENEEDQLLYRVPIFDPFAVELCTSENSNEAEKTADHGNGSESKAVVTTGYNGDVDSLHGFLPSDLDLAEFAADVESLLGRGHENESFAMEELGLVDYRGKDFKECTSLGSNGKVKLEEEEEKGVEAVRDYQIDMEREPFELNFDYDSLATCGDEDDQKVIKGEMTMVISDERCEEDEHEDGTAKKKKRKKLLSLDYEAVITAWESQGSPWTTGDGPEFDPEECWPDCMSTSATEVHQHHPYAEFSGIGAYPAMVDCGREARVSRYRQKRRTRLFSKKIRYEVRKRNAENRPRMKGRFVKRASSFAGPIANFPLLNK